MIRVYNTLTKIKEPFEPVAPPRVGMYLCGPTVYKPSHIGHMVGPVIFDTIKRYLVYSGYDVKFIVNITDVDDKLINEANQRGVPMDEVAAEMTQDYMRNLHSLGVDTIDAFPKCTEHMGQIIELTELLIEKGFAYEAQGDVYFEVSKAKEYGKLSHRSAEMLQGDGGGTAGRKRSLADFALWKCAKKGEPAWNSPWGPGRPGWHIECSAMSKTVLGETFDIHGGGLDLVFPHHENEVAQSESAHGAAMAKYWMHNGLMQASDEVGKVGGRATREVATDDLDSQQANKISKSKGSAPFHELLTRFPPETIRFFLLSTHYRRPIDYSEDRLAEVQTGMDTFYRLFKRYERITGESFYDLQAAKTRAAGDLLKPEGDPLLTDVAELRGRYLEAMDDDFNTGGGVAVLFDLARRLNKYADSEDLEGAGQKDSAKKKTLAAGLAVLAELARTLGLFRHPVQIAGGAEDALADNLMQLLIDLRAEARQKKDFGTADAIRDRLGDIGIVLEDRPGGTEWSRG